MAKQSMMNRERKRTKLAAKYAKKRAALKQTISSETASYEEKMAAVVALQKLPRDSSPSRGQNRCAITGRPRGVYRKFGLGRNVLRKAAMDGEIPGLKKSSW
ncbi:30S ribosomal protein S14 [Algiphilus sp.]|uniref:30S ribosomal protein S14 n=1 Tax=Algiphilus sp. TaxID=1872431 RepID=UPI001CA6A676|nr:30S ribosomal protein S14 [Algiphilus sp.]MBY8966697.1 30S ribosomal protein S14 [Algiphilus acroporae]MCI5061778.1 30S ribosomal protein S14 [Algiphilus sp.]MCI5103029.1 30S ribosomal protein S14 [Algiphilus sp.]MCR9091499.1 30S ribosomal protein S14 [Pseudomonadota bacterium]